MHPINTSPIEACKAENSAYYTSPMPANLPETASAPREGASNWFNGGIGIAAGRYFSNGAILLSAAELNNLKVRMSNAVNSGDGNDFSFDNITLVRATPTLNKEFSPSTIAQGETSTLTFTIQNTSENAAKPGWSFTDDLPADVRIAAQPNVTTTCLDDKSAEGTSATVTADPGATTLSVLGGLAPGSPSCTVTVDVTSDVVTPEGQPYVNDKNNMTMTGLLPPEPTTLTVIPKVALSITKTADIVSYTPGEPIVYTVTVANAASTPEKPISTAVGASVSDAIPSSITGATWTCAAGAGASCAAAGTGDIADSVTIPAGGSVVYTVTGTVTAGTTGAVVNTATVTPPPGTRDDTCADGCGASVTTPGSGIEIIKKINGDDANAAPGVSVPAGSTLDVEFTVTNTGGSTLTDVTVTDDTIAPLPADCTVPSLAPDASFSCTVTYPAPTEGGVTHTNTAKVTGTPPDGPAVTDEDPANATTVYEPGISVVKKINGDDANAAPGVSVEPGSDMTVTFEVTNTGNVTLTDVAVTDDVITDLPADCTIDALAPGKTFTCETTLTAPTAGGVTHTNTATVTGTPPQDANTPDVEPTPVTDDDPANATTTTKTGITVVKKINGDDANTAPGVSVEPGSDMTVTFEVTNTGNVTLTGVTVTDDVIAELPADCTVDSLAAGASFTCETTLAAPTEGGVTHTNTASVTGTPPDGPAVTDEDPANATTVYEPGITVVKKINGDDADTAPGVSVEPGSDMTVTFEVTNTGNVTLTGVTVADDVITELPAECTVDSLTPGETFTCETTTKAPAEGGVTHTNTATVTGTPPQDANTPDVDPTPVTDEDPANATTVYEPGVTVVKKINGDDANTAPGVTVEPGSDMTVTFEVTNTGNVTLTDVTVTDDVITELPAECTVESLAPGESFTCETTLAAPANGGTAHVNTATVTGTPPQDANTPDVEPTPVTDTDVAHATTSPVTPTTPAPPTTPVAPTTPPADLPATGATVSTDLLIGGGIIVLLGAAALLVARRRSRSL